MRGRTPADQGEPGEVTRAKGFRARLGQRIMCLERRASLVRAWWARRWLFFTGVALAIIIVSVAKVGIDLASQAVRGTTGQIRQMTMFVAVVQAVLAYTVAMATMSSARRANQTGDLMARRDERDAREKRAGAVEALVASAVETAGYAGWMVELQVLGLKWYRRFIPESASERELRVEGWKQLSAALARTAGAVERVRLAAPDLRGPAGELFDATREAFSASTRGDVKSLQSSAEGVRRHADHLRDAVSLKRDSED